MSGIFDDPEVRAEMQRLGIRYEPGLAQGMLDELAPLLAAEGIDVNDLDTEDLDRVNEVLARATERHNLELFTPIGVHRAGALDVLRRFAEVVAAGHAIAGQAVLDEIQPEPDGDTPAISHVIGVALGMLDEWLAARDGLSVRVPRWRSGARSAATDVVALGRKGRAFDAIGSLHRRYSGLDIYEGGALAVAATLGAIAAQEGSDVPSVGARLLGTAAADGGSRPATAPASAERVAPSSADRLAPSTAPPPADHLAPVTAISSFRAHPVGTGRARGKKQRGRSGNPAKRGIPPADLAALRGFGTWLADQPSIAAPTVDDEVRLMQALFVYARMLGLDAHDPYDIEPLVDAILDGEDEASIDVQLVTLHAYVDFQMQTAVDPRAWERAHDALDEVADDDDPGPAAAIAAAIAAADEVPEAVRREAFAQVPAVRAVADLLEWIGSRRTASPTGAARRSDIERVAGMLGVAAVGVNRMPRPWEAGPVEAESLEAESLDLAGFELGVAAPEPQVLYVLAMRDVPQLAAWWDALEATGIIETGPSRLRPGPAASDWMADDLPPLEMAEALIGMYLAGLLTHGLDGIWLGWRLPGALAAADIIVATLADELDVDISGPTPSPFERLTGFSADRMSDAHLQRLVDAGLLVRAGDDHDLSVPPALRGAVAHGLAFMMIRLAQVVGELDDDDEGT